MSHPEKFESAIKRTQSKLKILRSTKLEINPYQKAVSSLTDDIETEIHSYDFTEEDHFIEAQSAALKRIAKQKHATQLSTPSTPTPVHPTPAQ